MALKGAELLLYPTAIGSEPSNPELDSREHWMAVQQGHAAANMVPVVAANRVGSETIDDSRITFYGSSFIVNEHGKIVAGADTHSESIITYQFDREELARSRAAWGIFRDRRPDLYTTILTYDGVHTHGHL
jgi:N-carbamoylputrescine amidase